MAQQDEEVTIPQLPPDSAVGADYFLGAKASGQIFRGSVQDIIDGVQIQVENEGVVSELVNQAREYSDLAASNGVSGKTAAPADSPVSGINIVNVSEAGTYSNFGGLVVSSGDLDSGNVQLRKEGTVWKKVITPINLAAYAKSVDVNPVIDQVLNGGSFSLGSDSNTFTEILGTAGTRGNNEIFKHEAPITNISFWATRVGKVTIKLIDADLKVYFNQTFIATIGLNTLVSGVHFTAQKVYKGGRISFYVSTLSDAGSIGYLNPYGVGAFILSSSNVAIGATVSLATPTPAYFALKVSYTVKKLPTEVDELNAKVAAPIEPVKLKNSYILANSLNLSDVTPLKVMGSTGVISDSTRYSLSGFIPVSSYADGAMISISEGRLGTVGFFYDSAFNIIAGTRILGKSASATTGEFSFPKFAGAAYLKVNLDPQSLPLSQYMLVLAPELPKNYLAYDPAPVNPKIVYPWLYTPPLPFPVDKLKGKRIHCEGDSTWIAPPSTYTAKPLWAYIAEWTGCIVTSSAISGSGIVKNSGSAANAQGLVDRASVAWPAVGTIDMLSIFIGENDGAGSFTLPDGTAYPAGLPLGTFADGNVYPEAADLNVGAKKRLSYYGALHWLIQYAQYRYPTIPIVFISSTPRGTQSSIQPLAQRNNWGRSGWYEGVANAMAEVCGHYGVPLLDMYHQSNMRPWNDEFNTAFMAAGDRIHPGTILNEAYASKVYPFWLRNI